MNVEAIVVAAGKGKRMGHHIPKHLLPLEGRPILAHTLEAFEKCEDINHVLLVVRPEEEEYCLNEIVDKYNFKKVLKVVPGGERRQDSVYHGIKELDMDTDIVVVHDGVRPLVSPSLISDVVKMAMYVDGVIPVLAIKDTVKEITKDGFVKATPDRESLRLAQTPQAFKRRVLEEAFVQAYNDEVFVTDDASLVERIGGRIKVIDGSPENIKITTKEDLLLAEFILRVRNKKKEGK